MNRSKSDSLTVPGSIRRRSKKFTPVHPPDAWEKGWMAHPLTGAGPRWTVKRDGQQTERSTLHARGGSHRDRNTWIQTIVKDKEWVPAPGQYRTTREFMSGEPKDDVDTNLTVQEAAADYSFSREQYETSQEVKDVKPRRNNYNYPKLDTAFTPGPGSYMQYTTFGSASGGHRQSWMGGEGHQNWARVSQRTYRS
mmetsp:Transcript_101329/g.180095  ORF Transcript_101329/g.180095 Transcript_101329/m.180095 type:complete len:195 (+) Transcript_101329:56-640(+)|eukprot:CAMPEP_0197654474 /NCGR_PEP_ID=MMETSP1338-20131121/38870_1 /TAXON_ID=43686 ORGANISM="Pelagodinium beii, Strain RCC1491" /NCGR_SAMPLE_ID=MMETSP1338 /ASSEMBLY_ACC=CAM_ASM_000754 /LENGTH=194 /DNA_ID=CAMNT_0043229921 /DNA_START=47 /DNA_END=631 /DNA_ORIENTATION=-